MNFYVSINQRHVIHAKDMITDTFQHVKSRRSATYVFSLPNGVYVVNHLSGRVLQDMRINRISRFLFVLRRSGATITRQFFHSLLAKRPIRLFPSHLRSQFSSTFKYHRRRNLTIRSVFHLKGRVYNGGNKVNQFIYGRFRFKEANERISNRLFRTSRLFNHHRVLIAKARCLVSLQGQFHSMNRHHCNLSASYLRCLTSTYHFHNGRSNKICLSVLTQEHAGRSFLATNGAYQSDRRRSNERGEDHSTKGMWASFFCHCHFLPTNSAQYHLRLLSHGAL